ncbi:MAG: glycoside hydrolase family protein [Sphingomonas bacterium]|uniref:glycoside hydrolase family 19 protein n=1 Tax=Sphingomonas bacterium TaxID=1895847 RepID=UPI00262367C6|nr:glycoside hydrolase family 19 protein [Sphingomonas bacterium]MDB5712386.1 glycoside hydrolase family protein [Sphingomonas bacterium]
MVDWKKAQAALGRVADGMPGPATYTALYAHAAGREADAAITARAAMAATHFPAFGMTTAPRIAEFVAQTCNETGGFRFFEEKLGYRAVTLRKLWPKRFSVEQAAAAVGNPVEIASRAYGGRMGNAPHPSTEGHIYRGRGDLQLTGKDNYTRFGKLLDMDLVANPDLAAGEIGTLIALQFFKLGNVNAAVDAGDFTKARRIINGGTIGLDEVARIRERLLKVLG